MKKYYFFSSMYQYYQNGIWKPQSGAIDMHPIEWVNRLNSKVSNSETMLMGWQEITEEEFIMYNKKFIESQNK
jgi:hypothetical protein